MSEQADRQDQLLMLLVANLQQGALVQLGKLADPLSGETGVELPAARLSIDLLDMLRVKCRAGTAEPVVREIDRVVMDLQLNYTDVARRQDATATGTASETAPAAETGKEEATGQQAGAATEADAADGTPA